MRFLGTLFWMILTVVVVVFSVHNWEPLKVNLFGNLVWETKLPVPLLLAFLIGFVPLYLWHRAVRWRHRRALATVVPAAVAPPLPPISVEPEFGPARAD